MTPSSTPTSWIGPPVTRVEDARLLTGRGHFIDDHPPSRHPPRRHRALAARPRAHRRLRRLRGARDGRRGRRRHRRGRGALHPALRGRRARAGALPLRGHRQGPLRRGAGGGGRRAEPLSGRGRGRGGGRPVRAAARGRGRGAGARAGRARPPRGGGHEPGGPPPARLRRSRPGLRRGGRRHPRALPLPQVRLHPHRDLRGDRALGRRRGQATRSGRTSWGPSSCTGSSRACWACPRTGCASSCRPTSGAASGSSRPLSLYDADRAGRAAHRRAGQVDRGPARAPPGVFQRDRPRGVPGARGEKGRHRARHALSAGSTMSAATSAAPSPAAASARRATSSGRTASSTSRWTPRW